MSEPQSPFDTLILGGGTAGCALAARLSEDPDQSVCLLEAGPDYGPFEGGRWPVELVDARTPCDTHDWYPGAQLSLARARVLGGCSAHNACFVSLGDRRDYDEWARFARGWECASLEPHLLSAQRSVRTRPLSDEELGPWARTVRRAATEAGIPALDDFNDLSSPQGVAFLPVNVNGFARWNSAFAYLDRARERPNLTVLGDVLVDRILTERGRAVGALARRGGETLELEAGLVVLSAGAFGSPGILLRSGVGPADHLAGYDIPVAVDLPGVGANLLDHPGINMVFRASAELEEELGRQEADGRMVGGGTIARARSGHCLEGTWDIHLVSWSARDRERITGGKWRVQLSPYAMKPASAGTVGLRSASADEPLAVDLGFLSDEEGIDLEVIIDGVELVRHIAATKTFAGDAAEESLPGPAVASRAQIAAYVRANVRGYFHGVGTCRMGRKSDPGAVVNAACRVHGFENLYVCDASVMPTIPRANTNLTTIAIAERVAEIIQT